MCLRQRERERERERERVIDDLILFVLKSLIASSSHLDGRGSEGLITGEGKFLFMRGNY